MSREKERVSVVEENRQFDPPEAWRGRPISGSLTQYQEHVQEIA